MDKKTMEKFYEVWEWLDHHPFFAPFGDDGTRCLDVTIVKVNPENETIEDDDSLNTAVRVWLEGGPWSENVNPDFMKEERSDWMHDIDLDCGGKTYEEAVIKFAEKVREKYGDYGEYSPFYRGASEREKDIDEFLLGISMLSPEDEKEHLGPFGDDEPPMKKINRKDDDNE